MSHALLEPEKLLLENPVPLEKLLYGLVAVALVLEFRDLLLQPLDVLLGPSPNGPLSLPVVGPLAGKLRRRQGGHAPGP